jgi:peptide/nickel transport system substrate-binding protein
VVRLRATIAGLAIYALTIIPAAAENVLRFSGAGGGALTVDPDTDHESGTRTVTDQVYEALLDVDSYLAIVPRLAVAWKPLGRTAWEFQLRPDVRFHDGTPFTADDVVFSIDRARAETSFLKQRLGMIVKAEAVDRDTVHVTTAAPDPVLPLNLGQVAIMPKAWVERHGAATAADLKTGEETYASRHANGTGPFILEEFEAGRHGVLIRNPDWWGSGQYPQSIDRLVHVNSGDQEADLRALIDGELDLLLDVPFGSLDVIRTTPGLKLGITRKFLTHFFGWDQGSAELRSSNVKGKNPFKDKRVRQAMSHAIDIEAILGEFMGELLVPAGMAIPPGVNGYAPELDRRLAYDPQRAKALLAEAGYPEGFSVTLDCPNQWGDDQIVTCEGAAAQLREIGIDVTVNFLSDEEFVTQIYARPRRSDFFLDLWTSFDPDSAQLLKDMYHSESKWNSTGYINPKVDALIDKVEGEIVTYARDAYLEEALAHRHR